MAPPLRNRRARLRLAAHPPAAALVVASLLCCPNGWAEPPPARAATARRLDLAEALRLSQKNSETIAMARAGVDSARSRKRAANSGWWPQLSADASYQHTFESEYEQLFSGQPNMGQQGGLSELPFARTNAYRASVTASENLFSGGGTLAQGRVAQAGIEQSRLELVQSKAAAALQAASAYYAAALSDEALQIALDTLTQARQTLDHTALLESAGQEAEFDVVRARVAVQSQQAEVEQRKMERALAHLALKQLLGIAPSTELQLQARLATPSRLPDVQAAARGAAGVTPNTQHVAVEQARAAIRGGEAAVDAAQADYYPSVNVSTTYEKVHYPDGVLPDFDQVFTNFTAGVFVHIPIFEGFRTRANVSAAQSAREQARYRLRLVRKAVAYDAESAQLSLQTAQAVYRASVESVAAARRAYELAELRFREGVSMQLELNDTRLALERARLSQARAVRDVELSRVRLALLPALPLQGAGATGAPGAGAGAAAVSGVESSATLGGQSAGATATDSAPGAARRSGTGGAF